MATVFAYDSVQNPLTQPLLTANEQVFLNSIETTTVAAGSSGVNVNTFTGSGTLNVAATATFTPNMGGTISDDINVAYNPNRFPLLSVATANGVALLSYTGTTSTTFTGVDYISGQSGALATGAAVTNPQVNFGLMTGVASRITGSIFSDQAGTLAILQSFDGINWDIGNNIAVAANTVNTGINQETIAPYLAFLYSNGTSAQGAFRVHIRVFGNGRQGA